MNKKTKKALKKLSTEVSEVRKENAKLLRKLEDRVETLEKQAEANGQEMTASGARSKRDSDAPEGREITDAAARKAEDLGVDANEVEGTGSRGRVLVKDIERSAQEEQ